MIFQKNICCSLAALLAILFCSAHYYATPLVGEEARYASVAWQMFSEKHQFLPRYGEGLYLEKMPLLFWLLNLGWMININWPWQIIFPTFFAVLTLFYTQKLARNFFPDKPMMTSLVPLVLVCMPYFLTNLGLLRFDMALTFFNVLACYCLVRAKNLRRYYWYFVLINTLGVLTKGPVFCIFTLVESALYFLCFSNQAIRDIIKYWSGIALSQLIFFAYLMIMLSQEHIKYYEYATYLYHLFSDQVSSRIVGAKNKPVKPFWDYIVLLPFFFLPWMLFGAFLKAKSLFTESERNKKNIYFFMKIFIVSFIIFSIIKTKEARYLLPIVPFIAIIISYRLEQALITFSRQRYFASTALMGLLLCFSAVGLYILLNYYPQYLTATPLPFFSSKICYIIFGLGIIALMSICLPIRKQVILLLLASFSLTTVVDLMTTGVTAKLQNTKPSANFIAQLVAKHIPIASVTTASLDLQFLGRLPKAFPVFINSPIALKGWINNHQNGWLITLQVISNVNQPHAKIVDGCFEQTYDHLHKIMRICPVSRGIS